MDGFLEWAAEGNILRGISPNRSAWFVADNFLECTGLDVPAFATFHEHGIDPTFHRRRRIGKFVILGILQVNEVDRLLNSVSYERAKWCQQGVS